MKRQVEAAGIEPGPELGATADGSCDCGNCQVCRAAYALHLECFKRHVLSSLDVDLQEVIASWEGLPILIRNAIVVLADCKETTACHV